MPHYGPKGHFRVGWRREVTSLPHELSAVIQSISQFLGLKHTCDVYAIMAYYLINGGKNICFYLFYFKVSWSMSLDRSQTILLITKKATAPVVGCPLTADLLDWFIMSKHKLIMTAIKKNCTSRRQLSKKGAWMLVSVTFRILLAV